MPASLLSIQPFRRYLGGRIAGVLARQVLSVSVGWDVYARTDSAWALGFVGLVQVLPVVALVVPAGTIADRLDRRRIAAASQVLTAVVALALAGIAGFALPVPAIYAVLALYGCATAFHSPAAAAILPRLVPEAERGRANSWASTSFGLSAVAGPGLAGLIIAAAGSAVPAYLVAALGSAAFGAVLALLPRTVARAEHEGSPHAAADWRAGLRFVSRSPLLLPAITLDMFAVLFAGVTALLPIFARDILHAGAAGLGWLRAAPALGALAMAVAGTRLAPWRRPGLVLLGVVAAFGVVTLGFGLSRSFPLSFALLIVGGALDNVSVIIRITLEQMVTPDALRGRVSAVHYVFIGLSNELGEFESGVTAGLFGAVGSVLLGGSATLVVVALVAALAPALRELGPLHELRPARRSPEEAPPRRPPGTRPVRR